jgi:hypothetical protein
LQKAVSSAKNAGKGISDATILQFAQFLEELLEFSAIVEKAKPACKTIRLKRLNKTQEAISSARSFTPHDRKPEGYIKIRQKSINSRSFSKIGQKETHDSDRRLQFLQESRFNKRIIELLTRKLVEKMNKDPEYLKGVKQKSQEKYSMFKEEFIDIHKDAWIQECVKEIEQSTMLKICKEEDLKLIDAKKEAFFSYVYNSQLMKSVIEKAKEKCLKQ